MQQGPFPLTDFPDDILLGQIIARLDSTDRKVLACTGRRLNVAIEEVGGRRLRPGAWASRILPCRPNEIFVFFDACTLTYALSSSNTCEPLLRYKLGLLTVPTVWKESLFEVFDPTDLKSLNFAYMASPWALTSAVAGFLYARPASHQGLRDVVYTSVSQPEKVATTHMLLECIGTWKTLISKLRSAFYEESFIVIEEEFTELGGGERGAPDPVACDPKSIYMVVLFFQRRLTTFETAVRQCPAEDRVAIFEIIRRELDAMFIAWQGMRIMHDTILSAPFCYNRFEHDDCFLGAFSRVISRTFWAYALEDYACNWGVRLYPANQAQYALCTAYTLAIDETNDRFNAATRALRDVLAVSAQEVFDAEGCGNVSSYMHGEESNFSYIEAIQLFKLFSPRALSYDTALQLYSNARPFFPEKEDAKVAIKRAARYVEHFTREGKLCEFWDPDAVLAAQTSEEIPTLTEKEALLIIVMTQPAPDDMDGFHRRSMNIQTRSLLLHFDYHQARWKGFRPIDALAEYRPHFECDADE